MAITFRKLRLVLEAQGKKKFYLRQCGISPAIVDKLFNGGDVSTPTINKVCKYLNCQPGDIMEYIPDDPKEANKHG